MLQHLSTPTAQSVTNAASAPVVVYVRALAVTFTVLAATYTAAQAPDPGVAHRGPTRYATALAVTHTAPAPVVVQSASASCGTLLTRTGAGSRLAEQILVLVPQVAEAIVKAILHVPRGTQDRDVEQIVGFLVPQITEDIVEAIQRVPQEGIRDFIVKRIVAPVRQRQNRGNDSVCAARGHIRRGADCGHPCASVRRRKSWVFQAPAPVVKIISLAPLVFHTPARATEVSCSWEVVSRVSAKLGPAMTTCEIVAEL